MGGTSFPIATTGDISRYSRKYVFGEPQCQTGATSKPWARIYT